MNGNDACDQLELLKDKITKILAQFQEKPYFFGIFFGIAKPTVLEQRMSFLPEKVPS